MSLIHRITKYLLLACSLLSVAVLSADEPHISRINLARGERWWGASLGNIATATEVGQNVTLRSPMYISSSGRYIYSTSPMEATLDGKTIVITSSEKNIQPHKGGRTLRDAYLVCRHRHFPPRDCKIAGDIFSCPVIETELELGYMQSAEAVVEYARRIKEMGINGGIIVLSNGWSPLDGSLDFDRNIYPDPKATIRTLHDLGFRVMVSITPYRAASGRGYVAALRHGVLLCDVSGAPIMVHSDEGVFAVCDITRDDCRTHIEASLEHLSKRYGVDGFRFDCEELCRTLASRGASAEVFLDAWCSLGREYTLADYVPGTAALQRYAPGRIVGNSTDPYGYIGDMVSAGLMGVSSAYSTVDIDPESATDMERLRALQASLMMPMARIPFAPWRISSKEFQAEFVRNVTLRESMGKHLCKVAEEGVKTAEPMARHMEYIFPRSGFADCTNQYMLGDRYLVAPAIEGKHRMVRLPRGVWTDASGRRYRGPVVIDADASKGQLLLFERAQ